MFIVPAQTQQIAIQRLSPENKGVSPYTLLQAGYRNKKAKLNPHMAACDFIGYSFPQCYVTFMFQIFKFYLSALRFPPHLIVRTQSVCFFSAHPFPSTLFPLLILVPTQGQ
jgi:hypothetical protein